MVSPIRFLVIEDEPSNRENMIKLLNEGDLSQVLGEAETVDEAFEKIIDSAPDALLLDIKLIGGDAFQLLQRLRDFNKHIPPTVIITGHLDFNLAQEALNRFRNEVVYIIQKPFLDDWEDKYFRMCTAIRAAAKQNSSRIPQKVSAAVIYLRAGNATHRIPINEINYIQVGGQGTIVLYLSDKREIKVNKTLVKMLEELPGQIVRVHRKFAVHREKVSHIDHEDRMLYLQGMKRGIDIGEIYYPRMVELLAT